MTWRITTTINHLAIKPCRLVNQGGSLRTRKVAVDSKQCTSTAGLISMHLPQNIQACKCSCLSAHTVTQMFSTDLHVVPTHIYTQIHTHPIPLLALPARRAQKLDTKLFQTCRASYICQLHMALPETQTTYHSLRMPRPHCSVVPDLSDLGCQEALSVTFLILCSAFQK